MLHLTCFESTSMLLGQLARMDPQRLTPGSRRVQCIKLGW